MVISGPIDFLFGWPININVNRVQNKFEADVFKKCGQNSQLKAQNMPDATFEPEY